MFELYSHPVKIKTVNARAEHHGDEMKAMYDIKVVSFCENYDLIHFHPELRSMLFKRNDDPDLNEQGNPDALTKLRFPEIGSIKWDKEFVGYDAQIQWGIDETSGIDVEDCRLKKFVFTPQPAGGIVLIQFNLVAHIKPVWVGKVCELIKKEILLTLHAPTDKQGKLAA